MCEEIIYNSLLKIPNFETLGREDICCYYIEKNAKKIDFLEKNKFKIKREND